MVDKAKIEQAFAIRVLTYALKKKAGGLHDLGLVDHRAGYPGC